MTRGSRRGFTIVELLISAAIFGIVLTLLASIFVTSRRAYTRSEEVGETRQAIQAALELMNYDVGLAGYRGVDIAPAAISATRPFASLPLTVTDGTGTSPDTITVRFYEDRFVVGLPTLRTITYSIVDEALVRTDGTVATPVVDGVTDLQVNSWLNRAATEFVVPTTSASANRPAPANLAGIGLRIRVTGQDVPMSLVVSLPNPQCQMLPC